MDPKQPTEADPEAVQASCADSQSGPGRLSRTHTDSSSRTPMQIDEKSRRLPTFSEHSYPIRLHDGNEWHFPKPVGVIHPTFIDGRPVGLT